MSRIIWPRKKKNSFEWEFRKRFHNNSIKFLGPIVEGSICNPFWIQPTRATFRGSQETTNPLTITTIHVVCACFIYVYIEIRRDSFRASRVEMTVFSGWTKPLVGGLLTLNRILNINHIRSMIAQRCSKQDQFLRYCQFSIETAKFVRKVP